MPKSSKKVILKLMSAINTSLAFSSSTDPNLKQYNQNRIKQEKIYHLISATINTRPKK